MKTRIQNAFTRVLTNDIVGSKDELKYFRVIDGTERVDDPKKKFYDNKADYMVDTLFKRFKGKIEHLEGSLRSHLGIIESEWDTLKKLSDKAAFKKLEEMICDEPTVTFSYVCDNTPNGWTTIPIKQRYVVPDNQTV